MVTAAERKTTRTTGVSRLIRATIRRMLRNGPVSVSRVKKTIANDWLVDPQSVSYHAKCMGLICEGNSNMTRVWKLPQDQQDMAELEDSQSGGVHSCSRVGKQERPGSSHSPGLS